MDIESRLFQLGIGTWETEFITSAPANPTTGAGSPNFEVGKNLPTDVGFIYGLSMDADAIGNDGLPLPTTSQAQNMYIRLKDGGTEFMEPFKLSDLLNELAGSPAVRIKRYMDVAIPRFDLSKSEYVNPLLYTGFNLHLRFWYINTADWAKVGHLFGFDAYEYKGHQRQLKK